MHLYYFWLCLAQGTYLLTVGVWPLFSLDTFQQLTGPVAEPRLVRQTGLLSAVVGIAILVSGSQWAPWPANFILGGGTALVLSGVDVVFLIAKVLRPAYWADLAIHLGCFGAWVGLAARGFVL